MVGARISALFVILIVSSAATFFPVLAKKIQSFKVPIYVYLFARYFGAGVIVATAFIQYVRPLVKFDRSPWKRFLVLKSAIRVSYN